jgi:hypothetical protein
MTLKRLSHTPSRMDFAGTKPQLDNPLGYFMQSGIIAGPFGQVPQVAAEFDADAQQKFIRQTRFFKKQPLETLVVQLEEERVFDRLDGCGPDTAVQERYFPEGFARLQVAEKERMAAFLFGEDAHLAGQQQEHAIGVIALAAHNFARRAAHKAHESQEAAELLLIEGRQGADALELPRPEFVGVEFHGV